jgi:hypothetical protein
VPGVQTNHAAGIWYAMGNELESRSLRGFVDYVVNCPTSEMYRVSVNATHTFRMTSCSPVVPIGESDVQIYVDGRYLGKRHLVAPDGTYGKVEVFTPWLQAGPHTVRIFWENVHSRLSLRIRDVRLQQLGGADHDGNGVKDWMEASVRAQSGLDAIPAQSVVSPLCVEGAARFVDMMGISSAGMTGTVHNGILGRWYADVPLVTDGATAVAVSYQAGVVVRSNQVTWSALNLLTASNLTIRRNDSLKLTAFPDGATNGAVEVIVEGVTNVLTTVESPVICGFPQGGTYVVKGIYDGLLTNQITVTVVAGSFPSEAPACLIGATRNWSCTNMTVGAVLESDASVEIGWSNRVASLRMNAVIEDHYMVARAYTNGPILASSRLDGFWVQGAVDSYVWVVERYPDSQVLENTMVTKRVPASVSIQINIFVAGVTFDDMALSRWVTVNDLDELGSYKFRLLRPNSAQTSTCHTIRMYQGGVFIGEAYYGGILMPQE